ncbi:vacuolar protein sorting-associated protein 8 homolog [Protopterus annectens]|uniref:vacuolar protein sorting-associated protein 8 homolog n=1 Tax=Protopterus annectens TaxID=7888 RepID=UPI001CFAAD15|nr:vacuolar protein sorting-associated protein 8 homolog [Protopterus annectens]
MSESPETHSLVSASSQLNLTDTEEIDDKEFDIPQVDTPPTLESILNEPEDEDESFILDDPSLLNIENIDAHSCETSSLASSDSGDRAHFKFTDDPTLAICNDSGGSVFELTFKRVMGLRTCDSRCLFSGSKGEVCCIEPLRAKTELRDHPINQYSLLAMASLTKILIIGLKPSLKVWMTFPYGRMDPASVPLLSWHFVAIQNSVNPMLAFCRGDVVHFLLVKRDESGAVHVSKQKQLHLHYDLINLTWINSRTLLLLDSAEKLHVIDRQTQEDLETLDIADVQLVYNSSHFKSLATGGNVSQALALVGEKACYQSIGSYGGQIFYLGTKSVHVMMLRTWRERVEHLVKQERFTEALALAWSFHEGTAKAVIGLAGDPNKRKGVVADKMVEILFQYADRALKKCPEQGKLEVMEQYFEDMVPVMVDYCLLLQRTDLLFGQIYNKLSENSVAKSVFLECLEPYILNERLPGITPQIMKELLTYLQENGMMEDIETCIVHMDITSLDIQQLVQMCWENHLYDAMIYVYNSGMNDYITPMEKLFHAIGPTLHSGKSLTDEQVVMGNKLLVYISCCLAGRAYPLGDIPEDLVTLVKNQVYDFLICLHSQESDSEEEVYPYIRTLLHFDTREFLNVLALTFEDFKNDKQVVEYQQRIVDILLKVMVDNSDFTPSQVGCLFTFLARQLAKPDNTLFVNRMLFDQVLEFLCCPDDDSRHAERQQVLLELLQAGGIVQFDENRLIHLAERAEFYQICEVLYEKKHMYAQIVHCYLRDSVRKKEVFNYVHDILSIPGYSPEEKQSVWHKTMECVEELISVDPSKAADLVATHFADEIQVIIEKNKDQHLLFQFLKSLIDPRFSCPQEELGEGAQMNQEILQMNPNIIELYVELLCQYSPMDVKEFLQLSEHYRLDETNQITQKHQLYEASAYLLEKKGDVQGSFQVMLKVLKSKLSKLSNNEELNEKLLKDIEDTLEETISLCQRNSHSLNQQQRDALWFPLLEAMMSAQKLLKGPASQQTSEQVSYNYISYPFPGVKKETGKCLSGNCKVFNRTVLGTGFPETEAIPWDVAHGAEAVHKTKVSVDILQRNFISIPKHLPNCCTLEFTKFTLLLFNKIGFGHPSGSTSGSLKSSSEATLDPQQIQAFDELRRLYKGTSRHAVLTELSHTRGNERYGLHNRAQGGFASSSIFLNENFKLHLAPPPATDD